MDSSRSSAARSKYSSICWLNCPKVANRFAKTTLDLEGVLDITGLLERQLELLAALSVLDVWGIGSRWGQMLLDEGIDTALKLREQLDWWVRQHMG